MYLKHTLDLEVSTLVQGGPYNDPGLIIKHTLLPRRTLFRLPRCAILRLPTRDMFRLPCSAMFRLPSRGVSRLPLRAMFRLPRRFTM